MLCVKVPNRELPPNAGTGMLVGTVHLSTARCHSDISMNMQLSDKRLGAHAELHFGTHKDKCEIEPHPRKPSTKTRGSLFSPAYQSAHIRRSHCLTTWAASDTDSWEARAQHQAKYSREAHSLMGIPGPCIHAHLLLAHRLLGT